MDKPRPGNAAHWLPPEVTSFVGRRKELATARHLLGSTRLLTLTGTGGVGKSRLARKLAADLHRSFTGDIRLVQLAEQGDPALLVDAVGSSLGLGDGPDRRHLATLVDYLADQRLLLILDTCEHLLDGCAELTDLLLHTCPEVRVLATSRQPLGIDGESAMSVPSLSLPEQVITSTGTELSSYDAVRLFLDRAQAAAPHFTLDTTNQGSVVGICRRLDGIPLALELAAVRLRTLTPDELLAQLGRRFDLLNSGRRYAPSRQQTLRASVEWSFELCSATEQTLWARLSVFAGSFEINAAEAICASPELPEADIFDHLCNLVDKSVLIRDTTDPRGRFRMLETLREFGRERLASTEELDMFRLRHSEWYADLAQRAYSAWIGPDQARWIRRFHEEMPNFRDAFDCSLATAGDPIVGGRLAAGIGPYWFVCGMSNEGRHWVSQALASITEPVRLRADLLAMAHIMATDHGDAEEADAHLEAGLAIANRLNDDFLLANFDQAAALSALIHGDNARALEIFESAVRKFRATGKDLGLLHALWGLWIAARLAGDHERATAAAQEVVARTEAIGEMWARSAALWTLGCISIQSGSLHGAAEHLTASLRMRSELDDKAGIAVCLEALAIVAFTERRDEHGAVLVGAAQNLRRLADSHPGVLTAWWSIDHAAFADAARERLGAVRFDASRREGETAPLDQAVALGLAQPNIPAAPGIPSALGPRLTRRELEVARLIADGLTNRQIADHLVIARRTVDWHVEQVLTKFDYHSRAQIAAHVTAMTSTS